MSEYIPVEDDNNINNRTLSKFVIIHKYSRSIIVLKYTMLQGHTTLGGNRQFFDMIKDIALTYFNKTIQPPNKKKLSVEGMKDFSPGSWNKKNLLDKHSQNNRIVYYFSVNYSEWFEILSAIEDSDEFDLIPVLSHGRLL